MATALDVYTIVVNLAAGAGLLYLLYSGRYAVGYRRFFQTVTLGLFVSILGGPLLVVASESLRHAIHGIATLFIAVGLYDLVRSQLGARRDAWFEILVEDPGAFEGVDHPGGEPDPEPEGGGRSDGS